MVCGRDLRGAEEGRKRKSVLLAWDSTGSGRFAGQDRFALLREALAFWRWSNPWRTKVLMTACLLTLRSLAAHSSSSSMAAVKSTFTRWIGFLISPELVKKRETSLPLSAIRAMVSAETGFFLRRVFFIKSPLRTGCFP